MNASSVKVLASSHARPTNHLASFDPNRRDQVHGSSKATKAAAKKTMKVATKIKPN